MRKHLPSVIRSVASVAFCIWISGLACKSSGAGTESEAASAAQDNVEVITHATVIDPASGTKRSDMTIVIRGTRIATVGPSATIDVPSGARTHDASGQFVIPGLWDTHVHLSQAGPDAFPLFIANGITSVRDMGSDFNQILKWRADRTTGALIPRIISPGPKLDGGSFMRRLLNSSDAEVRVVTSPADARRAVDELKARGVDFIKVHNGLTPPLYDAIVAESKKDQLTFAGHLPVAGPLAAAAANQRTIEHGRGMLFCSSETWARIQSDSKTRQDAEYCAPLTAQPDIFPALLRAGAWFTPTLVSWRGHTMIGDPGLDSWLATISGNAVVWPALRHHWDEIKERPPTPFERELMGQFGALTVAASRAGVPLLAGTDLGDPYVIPGYALHDELELLVAAGVTPLAALQSATTEPARAFGLSDTLGQITPGQAADLVLLNGNPLADIRNTRRVSTTVLNGHWLEHQAEKTRLQ